MPALLARIRILIATLTLLALSGLATPVFAQQPASVNPTASAVKEDQLLGQLRIISGRGTLPDTKSYNLEQPAGRDWQYFNEVTLRWTAGVAILGMLALLVLFYLVRGMVRIEGGRSSRKIVRFNAFERFVHWMTATCFIVLALTGLNITFGKELLLGWMGAQAFADWSQWAKYAHNFVSFPFTLGVVVIFLMWLAWTIPTPRDLKWIAEGGGIVGHKHLPASRFNGGQKLFYWVVVLGGAAVAVTGYLLLFPFYVASISGMQTAEMVHGIVSVLFVAVMFAHIYIGSIGMEGAFESMGTGEVDLNWAKQHHSLWVEKKLASGRGAVPPEGATATPAE